MSVLLQASAHLPFGNAHSHAPDERRPAHTHTHAAMVPTFVYGIAVVIAPLFILIVRATIDCARRRKSTGMQVPLLAYVPIMHCSLARSISSVCHGLERVPDAYSIEC